jgi:hypothetical protein
VERTPAPARHTSAPALFLGGLLLVLAVGGATAGVTVLLDLGDDDRSAIEPGDDGSTGPSELLEDQVAVTGLAVGVTVQGATFERLDTPLTVTTPAPGGGAGATLHDVEVDGDPTEVVWDAGRPFDLQGAGLGIIPRSLNIFAAPTAITVGFPDEEVHELVSGAYGLQTPVAVGRGGLAIPQQAVAFEATVESTIVFRGGATTSILPRPLEFESAGRVLLQGILEVRRPDGSTIAATAVELPEGGFRLACTPRPDGTGYDVEVLLQGDVTVT